MSDSPKNLLDRLVEPFHGEPDDWADVLKRAEAPGRRGRRFPRALVLAAALLVIGLAVAAPFGLAGKVIGLFREGGKPVPVASLSESDRSALILTMCSRVDLVTPAGKAPEKRCADPNPRIEEIANNGTRRYWKVTFANGTECLASGRVRGYRENGGGRSHIGSMGCGKNSNLFPNPKRPITVDAAISFSVGDRRARLFRASGLAGEGVARVGLVEKNGDVLKTDVEGRAYDFNQPPNREWEAIAAYDASGNEVYRESLHLDVPRREFTPTGPPKPPRPKPLPPLPKQQPLQHGEVPGATIDVYRSGLAAVHLTKDGRPYRLLRSGGPDPRVNVGCENVAYGAGHWETLGSESEGTFGPEIQAVVSASRAVRGELPRLPLDACSVRETYGITWNDARGTHAAVEIAFTPLGQRYLDERAVALDLALFMRTPEMRSVRKAMEHGRVPAGAHIAALFPSRVVRLETQTDSADSVNIGIWTNRKDLIVVSRRAEDGRRLYVTLRGEGAFGPNNLAGLRSLYY
jgi:hypothetical protein